MEGHAALQIVKRSLRQLMQLPARVSADAAEVVESLLAQQFAEERDPYGTPWEPHAESTVKRWGEHPILDLTGDMKDVSVRPLPGSGVGITLGAPYSRFHQTGTAHMPPRPILPDGRGLPPDWVAALSQLTQAAFGKAWVPV